MAIQIVRNCPILVPSPLDGETSAVTLDAAGESVAVIGYLQLPAMTGSKTLSTGKIYTRLSSPITFSNASTTIRVGVQDVSATTGLEDTTFDVSGDWVGGTDTLTANTYRSATMGSGTKTIAHGDLIAVVIEVISRGGTDSVPFRTYSSSLWAGGSGIGMPYGTADTGTLAKAASFPFVAIEFDDGTVGWLQGVGLTATVTNMSVTNFNPGTSPDEYIASFTPAATMQVAAIGTYISAVTSVKPFEMILYSDPYGSPSAVQTVTPDVDQFYGTSGVYAFPITPTTLTAGTVYGVAVKAIDTMTGSLQVTYIDLGSGNAAIKNILPFPDVKLAGRADATGAFSEVQTYYVPFLYLDVCGLDDGVSSGGATARRGNPLGVFRL